jgi:hypothetical protein
MSEPRPTLRELPRRRARRPIPNWLKLAALLAVCGLARCQTLRVPEHQVPAYAPASRIALAAPERSPS